MRKKKGTRATKWPLQTANDIRNERFVLAAQRRWASLMNQDNASFDELREAALTLRDCVRVGQS